MAYSQPDKVLDYLKKHGSITSWQAITELRVTRLSAVIFRLKDRGYDISSFDREKVDSDGNKVRWVEYRLRGDVA